MRTNSLVIVGKVVSYDYEDENLTVKIKNGVDYYNARFKYYVDKDKISDILNIITKEKTVFRGYLDNLNSGEVFKIYITSYKKLEK